MEFPNSSLNQADSERRNWKNRTTNKCILCGDLQNDCPGRRFYSFPTNRDRSEKWAKITQKKWVISATPAQRCVRYRICENHFVENDFVSSTKLRLTSTAIPTFNIPCSVSVSAMKSLLCNKLKGELISAEDNIIENPSPILSDIINTPIRNYDPSISDTSRILMSTPSGSQDQRCSFDSTSDVSGIEQISCNVSENHGCGVESIANPAEIMKTPVRVRRTGKRRMRCTPKTLKIKRMSSKLYYLQKKYEKVLTKTVSIKQVLNSVKGLVSPMSYSFIESQLKNARVSKFGRRWSVRDKSFALRLYMYSPKAYFSLKHIFVLPCKSTIAKCLSGIKLNPGFSESILNSMKFLASKLKPHDKKCIVSFDEMKLKAGLSFDVKHDQIIGFENYGTFSVKNPRLATHALVFMVRGLCKKWKQVFGFFYSCESASSAVLKHLLHEGISKLVNCGLEPIAVVCDQGASNQRLYTKELGITDKQPFFFVQGRKIYTLYDTPHLLKSVRNNFSKYNVKFTLKGLPKVAQWKHIYKAWEFDEEMTHRFAPKLTKEHVVVKGFKTMSVKLATQVLSQSVASILCYMSVLKKLKPDATFTADFCATMNDLFDSVNGRMIKHDRPLLSAVSKDSPHLDVWKTFTDFMRSVEFQTQVKHGNRKVTFPCLQGWLITLSAFRQMIPELLITIPYILMSRFTQDALENFFSVVRRKGGNNDHPTPVDFKSRIRLLMAEHLMNTCNSTNCEPDEDTVLIPLQVLIDNSGTENSEIENTVSLDINLTNENINVDDPDSTVCDDTQDAADFFSDDDVHEVNSAAYVAGYIAKIALKKFQCESCKLDMVTEKSLSQKRVFMYFKEHDDVKFGLNAPTDSCLKTVYELGKNFKKLFDAHCYEKCIMFNITQKLHVINHDWLSCASHREELWEHILKKYVSLMIFYKVKYLTRNMKDNKKVAKKRKKIS